MSRINTNVSSLIAQRILGQQNLNLSKSLERLSTGLAINRGSDGPAALIASERLRSEQVALTSAIGNAERADHVVNIAEGGLQEINALLLEVQSLVNNSANEAGLSIEEKHANQLQVDSILQTIDRISTATTFQDTKLLNGNYDFTISHQAAIVDDVAIHAAKLGHNDTRAVNIVVTASAQHGGLFLSAGGVKFNLTDADARFTIEIAGDKGAREFSFASGTLLIDAVDAINTFKSVTGVSAAKVETGIALRSEAFGSNAFVSVDVIDAAGQNGAVHMLSPTDENTVRTSNATAFASVTNPIRDNGQDVGAIVNGITATSDGKSLTVNTDFLNLDIDLSDAGATQRGKTRAFNITGGGAKFNLGPSVNFTNQVSLGVPNIASRHLGRTAGGSTMFQLDDLGNGKGLNMVDGDLQTAQTVVNKAISQVSTLRGRLGAFQSNVIGATIRSLGVTLENTSAAESAIRDTDFASESAQLTRSQILVNAATNVLAIANALPQNVLSLLG